MQKGVIQVIYQINKPGSIIKHKANSFDYQCSFLFKLGRLSEKIKVCLICLLVSNIVFNLICIINNTDYRHVIGIDQYIKNCSYVVYAETKVTAGKNPVNKNETSKDTIGKNTVNEPLSKNSSSNVNNDVTNNNTVLKYKEEKQNSFLFSIALAILGAIFGYAIFLDIVMIICLVFKPFVLYFKEYTKSEKRPNGIDILKIFTFGGMDLDRYDSNNSLIFRITVTTFIITIIVLSILTGSYLSILYSVYEIIIKFIDFIINQFK